MSSKSLLDSLSDRSALVCFVAGAASSTLVWWTLSRGRDNQDKQNWMEEIKSRIGELPNSTKRVKWPWDEQHRRRSSGVSEHEDENETTTEENTPPPPPPLSPQEKTGLCIGSIFGLDVGGTLAKLVYFEQRPHDLQQDSPSHRNLQHHRAASAKLVLQARRGSDATPLNNSRMLRRSTTTGGRLHTVESEKDLSPMYLVRQESLPDDLNEQDVVGDPIFPTPPSKPTLKRQESSNLKKSRSMMDISKSRDYGEALDRFYNFARRLDVYETAVKDKNLSFYSRQLGGDFHFIRFETRRMDNAMHLIRINDLHRNIVTMGATGGGAHKYATDWQRVLGIQMEKQDELDSLVAGMQFVMATAIGECYTYQASENVEEQVVNSMQHAADTVQRAEADDAAGLCFDESSDDDDANNTDPNSDENVSSPYKGLEWTWTRKVPRDVASSDASTYPYLLVTIGTGVSVLRVDGPRKHERISGSTIGGGTYWGLIRLLTDVETFEDAMKLAERGDPSKVDMMVGDIYGQDSDALEKVGLPADLVASSFGKLVAKQDPATGVKQEDLARALLLMVTNNIGQVAYLNAKLCNISRIYFVGNFLRQNQISQHRLSYAIDYWSKGQMEALFLEHEGYFGALGAFLLSQNITHGDSGSFLWEGKSYSHHSNSESVDAEFTQGVRRRRNRTMSSIH